MLPALSVALAKPIAVTEVLSAADGNQDASETDTTEKDASHSDSPWEKGLGSAAARSSPPRYSQFTPRMAARQEALARCPRVLYRKFARWTAHEVHLVLQQRRQV